jgi:hypothetical protein
MKDNKVTNSPTTNQLQDQTRDPNVQNEATGIKKWFRYIVNKIASAFRWLIDLIKPNNDTEIAQRNVDNIATEPTEAQIEKSTNAEFQELTNLEFQELIHSGNFSNETQYIVNGDVTIDKYLGEQLPAKIKIIGNCTISNSANLISLPSNFIVNNLSLINNPNFTTFPDGLTVTDLEIISCPITSLANTTTILGKLWLESCQNLQAQYNCNITLNGHIAIAKCPKLFEDISLQGWPSWINSLDTDRSPRLIAIAGNFHIINLPSNSKLILPKAEHIIQYYKKYYNPDSLIKFFVNFATDPNEPNHSYINDIPYIIDNNNKNLYNFLIAILEAKYFELKELNVLAPQIVRILNLFTNSTDSDIYQQALSIVNKDFSNYNHGVRLALDDLLMLTQQQQALASGSITEMQEAKRHKLLIDTIDSVSSQQPAENDNEKADIILIFRHQLRRKLALPKGMSSISSGGGYYFDEYRDVYKLIESKATKDLYNELYKDNHQDETKIPFPSYGSLPRKHFDEVSRCPHDFMENDYEMVLSDGILYNYEFLLEGYNTSGLNPHTLKKIDPNKMFRVSRIIL